MLDAASTGAARGTERVGARQTCLALEECFVSCFGVSRRGP